MNEKTLLYEELSINAHPALQTQVYDGWLLRFANGYTNRANSVNPLYPSSVDIQEKINECERRYFMQCLPTVYKLNDGADANLDRALGQRGYSIATPTYVMEMDLRDSDFPDYDCVIADHADDEWLKSFFSFSLYSDTVNMATAKQMLDNVKNPMMCGRIIANGKTVACGSAVVECGYMGLYNVVVDERERGKGYGRAICESLVAAAKRKGARTAYLQVVEENHVAVGLYAKMGYKPLYSYWYRVKRWEAQ
jgi:GNAT superfamily N-acetyltransferase